MLNVFHIKRQNIIAKKSEGGKLIWLFYCYLLANITLIMVISNAHAGSWTLPKGEKQTIITTTYYSTSHFIDADGTKSKVNRFTKYEISPYIEYGFRDGITIGTQIPLQYLEQKDNFGNRLNNTGIAGVDVFSRFRLLQENDYIVSVQPLIKFPATYSIDDNPRGGHDDFDTELTIQAGYNFNWRGKSHYLDSSISYRHRFGELNDQLKISLNAGFTLNDRFTLMPELNYTRAIDADLRSNITVSGQNDYHLAKAQLSVLYRINDYYRVQVGAYRHVYSRATGDDNGLLAAVWTNF